jgi:hypothetical protein
MGERQTSPDKPKVPVFIDWSDEFLNDNIREAGVDTQLDYLGLVAELNRRAANRQAQATIQLSKRSAVIAAISVVIAAISVAIALATVIVSALKP